jgi:hypothetical protein
MLPFLVSVLFTIYIQGVLILKKNSSAKGLKKYNLVVCFLLGYSPVSEVYVPVFQNTLSHLHRRVGPTLPAYADGTECPKTLAYKLQMQLNNPEESIQHSEHGESLKSRSIIFIFASCDLQKGLTVSNMMAVYVCTYFNG